jgi:hypothetical protein
MLRGGRPLHLAGPRGTRSLQHREPALLDRAAALPGGAPLLYKILVCAEGRAALGQLVVQPHFELAHLTRRLMQPLGEPVAGVQKKGVETRLIPPEKTQGP